jgi:hypothetical protein
MLVAPLRPIPAGPLVDRSGQCCDNAVLDACGVCNGTAKVIDVLNRCCNGTLDALGMCCMAQVRRCW